MISTIQASSDPNESKQGMKKNTSKLQSKMILELSQACDTTKH